MSPKIMSGPDVEEIFASSEIFFHNQPVGLILAETMELANHAANFVQITYKMRGKEVGIFF